MREPNNSSAVLQDYKAVRQNNSSIFNYMVPIEQVNQFQSQQQEEEEKKSSGNEQSTPRFKKKNLPPQENLTVQSLRNQAMRLSSDSLEKRLNIVR